MLSRLPHILSILSMIFLAACNAFLPVPQKATNTPLTLEEPHSLELPLHATWQIQYSGEIDYSLDVDVYNLDLFETSAENIVELHERNIYVMCYFSAGSWENWRPDADQFPKETIGKDYDGWPGEKWLDIRSLDALAPVLEGRIQMAVDKGCDGVDPDNVNGFENETGFPLTYADQLSFNIWLAKTSHNNNLDIGLKNDLDQIDELVPYFDWVLNEECFIYNECELLSPFYKAGKPVFVIEYETTSDNFCQSMQTLGFSALQKNWELDAYRKSCQ